MKYLFVVLYLLLQQVDHTNAQVSRFDKPAEQPLINTYVSPYSYNSNVKARKSKEKGDFFSRVCAVSYQKGDKTWSKDYHVNVQFMPGSRLNFLTETVSYISDGLYGIIFWGKGQASVIKIDITLSPLDLISIPNTVKGHFGELTGRDKRNVEWRICKDDFCF